MPKQPDCKSVEEGVYIAKPNLQKFSRYGNKQKLSLRPNKFLKPIAKRVKSDTQANESRVISAISSNEQNESVTSPPDAAERVKIKHKIFLHPD